MVKPVTERVRNARKTNRARARAMRHVPVATEDLFWSIVRNRQIEGRKFKRQVLIDPYIADFVCAECRLIVELDGPMHKERGAYDARRDAFLRREGYRVLRFTDNDLGPNLAVTRAILIEALRETV